MKISRSISWRFLPRTLGLAGSGVSHHAELTIIEDSNKPRLRARRWSWIHKATFAMAASETRARFTSYGDFFPEPAILKYVVGGSGTVFLS